jgi:RimJ/RimL family protein N-acetyltransferase
VTVFEDLDFRPLVSDDTDEVLRLWSDYETVKFTNWVHTPTRSACHDRLLKVLEHYRKDPLHFGPYTIRIEGDRFVGLIGADRTAALPGEYEVWYAVCRDHWRRGIASGALARLLSEMIRSGRVTTAKASAVTDNPASWRLLEQHGFLREDRIPGGHQRHGLALDLFTYRRELR